MSKIRVDEIETLDGLVTIPLDTIVVDSDMLATNIAVTPAGTISSTTVQAALEELDGDIGTKQPLDATLTALAAQVTAANKLIYATGEDNFAQTDLTPYARTLIAQTNATDARSALGILDTVFTEEYTSPNTTIVFGTSITFTTTPNLTGVPKQVVLKMRCKVAAAGYSVGDIIYAPLVADGYSSSTGCAVEPKATEVVVHVATSGFWIINKSTKAAILAVANNWDFILEARR